MKFFESNFTAGAQRKILYNMLEKYTTETLLPRDNGLTRYI